MLERNSNQRWRGAVDRATALVRRYYALLIEYLHRVTSWLGVQARRSGARLARTPVGERPYGVIRHRIRRLPRYQEAMVVALALVGVGFSTMVANATTVPEEPTAPIASARDSGDGLFDRDDAADRADRSARGGDDTSSSADNKDKGKGRKAENRRPPKWVHPMPGAATTSCFGPRWGVMHAGVDLAGPSGTPIRAVGAGTVKEAGWVYSGYGISVVIDHGDGYYTHYAHASQVKVKPGQKVKPGDIIALEGSTGDSTGPHLHFEVHKGWMFNQVEPTKWMANRGVQINGC